jgi:hypothetical protein
VLLSPKHDRPRLLLPASAIDDNNLLSKDLARHVNVRTAGRADRDTILL